MKNDKKLSGKYLLKYLDEIKHIKIKDYFYNSPIDDGYNPSNLDESIWIPL